MPAPLRIALALLVLGLLARAGRVAWDRRDLALDVWRAIRPRHVAGAVGLLVLVLGVAGTIGTVLPVTLLGLGDLFGTGGANAVFTPVDVAAEATAARAAGGVDPGDLLFVGLVTAFLGLLALLLPWFAFVEEEVFRAGAEVWSVPRRAAAALVFGAAHLVMLVPVAAALGIAGAGAVYGEVYRRGVASDATPPDSALRAFRPTSRSTAATRALHADPDAAAAHRARQVAGVHRATVWHTTFNTGVVLFVWATLVVDTLRG